MGLAYPSRPGTGTAARLLGPRRRTGRALGLTARDIRKHNEPGCVPLVHITIEVSGTPSRTKSSNQGTSGRGLGREA